MILAAFGIGKLGDLYFVEKNSKMNTLMYKGVLQRHLKRSMKNMGCHIFVQDVEQDVCVLDRVSQSCDLNPIENLWTSSRR